jgi:Tol biopolymer transport system component
MIVFSAAHMKQNCHIYLAEDNGSHLFCLTGKSGLVWCQGPVLSPDKSQITFFAVPLPQLENRFHVIKVDGTGLSPLPFEPAPNKIIAWLHDGRLFYLSERKYWTANLDGSSQRHEAYLDGFLVMDVSLDGRQAVVTKGAGIQKQIYIADLDGCKVRPLFTDGDDERGGILYPVALSPDGEVIACVGGYENEIWVVNIDGSNGRMLAEADYFWLRFNWSPGGKQIAFVRSLDHGGPDETHGAIYIASLDSREQRRVVEVYRPGGKWCWSADGWSIFYTTFLGDRLQVFSTDMQGRNRKLLDGRELGFDEIYDLLAE